MRLKVTSVEVLIATANTPVIYEMQPMQDHIKVTNVITSKAF